MSRQSGYYPSSSYQQDLSDAVSWRESVRVKLFFCSALAIFLVGLIVILFQPVVYRSNATVLLHAPAAVDADISLEDVQKVAIQRSILLGPDIVRQLITEIEERLSVELKQTELWNLLQVELIPETNLVELVAEGDDRELLPPLVEAWIDVYLDTRASEIQQAKVNTISQVEGELSGMSQQLEGAREALEHYREEHGIISVEREENEAMAMLDGLNNSLNNAIEEEVSAKAYLASVKQAISGGKSIVAESQRTEINQLQSELSEFQTRLAELNKRYTAEYIQKEPRLREIPLKIEEIRQELNRRLDQGKVLELASAEQKYTAARLAVTDLKTKLDVHKQKVSDFNRVYATHQALADDLARLEEINREARARLVQMEVQQVDKYPQVQVISWPSGESERIGPPYFQYFLIALGISTLSGIFCVWLYGFLGDRTSEAPYITLSGVNIYPQEGNPELASRNRTQLAPSEKALLQGNGEQPAKDPE